MAEVIEAGVGTLNTVKQTAKGAAPDFTSTTGTADRPRWVDGVLDPAKTLGQTEVIDGQTFGSPTTFTDKVSGDVGNVVIELQPENADIYCAYALASDVVTGAGDPWTHTITSGNGVQPYIGLAQSVGNSIGPKRDSFWDAKVNTFTLDSSEGQQPLTADMGIKALKAGQIMTTAAAKTEQTSDPYLHTETDGQITLDGTLTCEVDQSVVTIDRKQIAYWGNSIEPCQIVDGKGEITASVKSIVTNDTLSLRNKILYNTATPAVDTRPVKDVYYVSITRKYVRSATRSVEIQTPRVACKPEDLKVGAKRDGGMIEITFGGRCQRNGATPAITIIVKNGVSAARV